MTAEPRDVEALVPRDVEEIAALVRRVQSLPTAAAELVAREFVADRLAAADRENAELRGELQAKNESALVTIIRVVSETYTDAGVLLWLNAKNRHLRSKPDGNHRCTPAEYIAAGYAAEVLEAARRIEGSL